MATTSETLISPEESNLNSPNENPPDTDKNDKMAEPIEISPDQNSTDNPLHIDTSHPEGAAGGTEPIQASTNDNPEERYKENVHAGDWGNTNSSLENPPSSSDNNNPGNPRIMVSPVKSVDVAGGMTEIPDEYSSKEPVKIREHPAEAAKRKAEAAAKRNYQPEVTGGERCCCFKVKLHRGKHGLEDQMSSEEKAQQEMLAKRDKNAVQDMQRVVNKNVGAIKNKPIKLNR